jgi:hypothetical protein
MVHHGYVQHSCTTCFKSYITLNYIKQIDDTIHQNHAIQLLHLNYEQCMLEQPDGVSMLTLSLDCTTNN